MTITFDQTDPEDVARAHRALSLIIADVIAATKG